MQYYNWICNSRWNNYGKLPSLKIFNSYKDAALFLKYKGNGWVDFPAQKCLSLIRTAAIIRMTMLEGSAFFGLVITMLIVKNGTGILEPIYYANVLSIIPLLFCIALTFPTAEKLEKIFKENIRKD
jgi:hypothetical protein